MQLIHCPWCGPRDESEYRFDSAGMNLRPQHPAKLSDEAWSEYLYPAFNVKGPQMELWRHELGCRGWFYLNRNTLTHEVLWTVSVAGLAGKEAES